MRPVCLELLLVRCFVVLAHIWAAWLYKNVICLISKLFAN